MSEVDRIVVGKFVGVYGIKGWLKVKSFTEPATNIFDYNPWFVHTPKGLKVFEVRASKSRPQGLVVQLAGVEDRNAAEEIRGDISVDRSNLPKLDSGDYYWHQLMGLSVFSQYEGKEVCLGQVKGLMETGANDVLVVSANSDSLDDRERLVPYVPGEFILDIDLDAQRIVVHWDPEF